MPLLPGGYLGLHLGLIGVVGTRDELASVLAHELSHVTQRHIARLLTQQSRQTPLLLGAMVLGALAASKNPGATQALVVGGQALALQNQLNFSRDMEREADRVGMGLMEPAGFAPRALWACSTSCSRPTASTTTAAGLPAQPPADHAAHSRHAVAPALGRVDGEQPLCFAGRACHGHRAGAGAVQTRCGCAAPVGGGAARHRLCSCAAARQAGVLYAAALAPASCAMRQGRGAGRGSCSNWSRTMLRPPGWQNC
jgi:hypothetical protein